MDTPTATAATTTTTTPTATNRRHHSSHNNEGQLKGQQPATTTTTAATATNTNSIKIKLDQLNASAANGRKQFSSFILFLSVIILVNLCPFQSDFEGRHDYDLQTSSSTNNNNNNNHHQEYLTNNQLIEMFPKFSQSFLSSPASSSPHTFLGHLDTCLEFVKLMFKNPIRLGKRTTRFTQAEARVLGKMAKVWYIKKKIKKLSKKLKKHTIAVPVFTAIPIYEHSYYPQPHVTHVTHGGMHHAASSYSPTLAQMAATNSIATTTTSANQQQQQQQQQQQLATSASNNHQIASYRMAPGGPGNGPHHGHHPNHAMYHPMHSAGQIINAYAPSPALYVDDTGGLYGTYGNAYGRYDGGYHYW